MAIYTVGDLQGCYKSLMKLLEKVSFDPKNDELWAVGDLINRGPKNYEVLKFCMGLGELFTGVLGNHDLHFLAVALGYQEARNGDTFQDVLGAPDLDEIVHWLRQLKLLHYDKSRDLAMVHAGIPPIWSIKKARKLANEVEIAIRDEKQSRLYFANMYGNDPNIWSKKLSGVRRWRVITNYLTRMRFCNPRGRLELRSKAGITHAPSGYMPWFQVSDRKAYKTTILFGHWAALLGVTDVDNALALDTGCVWGERMTAVDIDNLGKRISVKCQEK